MANALADSFVARWRPFRRARVAAQVMQHAANATETRLLVRLLTTAILGALLGALIGSVVVLAIGRSDRRLRQRDLIADAIGVPVLASISIRHPTDAARWSWLLDDYEPSAADAFRLRSALNDLGLAEITPPDNGARSSLSVLSFSSDQGALALGPHLAAFAASLGIPTALVIGPRPDTETADTKTAAALRAAAAPSPRRSGRLRVIPAEGDNLDQPPDAVLTVVVAAVDGRTPSSNLSTHGGHGSRGFGGRGDRRAAGPMAASAAADNRRVAGILSRESDPADPTTRPPSPVGAATGMYMPTRMAGMPW
jgi:hypothetical protein